MKRASRRCVLTSRRALRSGASLCHNRRHGCNQEPSVFRQGQSMRLAGCVAVVTGGASGIGRVLTERLLADGAAVAILDIVGSVERAQSLRERRPGDHSAGTARVIGLPCDVSNEVQVAAAISTAASELGRIDILVNNAALFSSLSPGPFEDISAESWQRRSPVVTSHSSCSRSRFQNFVK